jgi:hypothetical protein
MAVARAAPDHDHEIVVTPGHGRLLDATVGAGIRDQDPNLHPGPEDLVQSQKIRVESPGE